MIIELRYLKNFWWRRDRMLGTDWNKIVIAFKVQAVECEKRNRKVEPLASVDQGLRERGRYQE